MGKKEQFSFEDIPNYRNSTTSFPEKKGVYISRTTIIIYVLLSIFVAVIVGFIVHFANPLKRCVDECALCPCITPTPAPEITNPCPDVTTTQMMTETSNSTRLENTDIFWEQCLNISRTSNKCFPKESQCVDQPEYVDYRLPANFAPLHYTLEIHPDIYQPRPYDFTFVGFVTIFLVCREANDVIVLHSRQLAINDSALSVATDDGQLISVNSTLTDIDREFYMIHLGRRVEVGENISVSLSFAGFIYSNMYGMYYSDYNVGNETKYMLVTQFQSTDARRAFPCLDEPEFKATFKLTLWRKRHMTALSNMPRSSTIDKGDGWFADEFDTTAVAMPTYLFAFMVAEYSYVEGVAANGLTTKQMRHWARPGYVEQGFANYSLDACIQMMDYFENYFNFTYDMPKTDQVAVPDFDAGAMENWGLITYKEARILWDPAHSTLYEKQRATGTLGHELVHQWLGNVVTCASWNGLWLQEGMARYHQHLGMKVIHPDWDVDQMYAVQVTQRAMKYDQTGQSHPISTPTNTPEEINALFSPITYGKAACVIRMIHQLVLGESYQVAMKKYIKQHAYGSVTFHDLFRAWDQQAKLDNINVLPPGRDIKSVMFTWILQMGYPVVMVTRQDENSTLTLNQEIFLENSQRPFVSVYDPPFGYTWDIPITFVTSKDLSVSNVEWLLTEGEKVVSLSEDLRDDDWVLANYKQYGFFRVNYDTANWNSLNKQLLLDHTVFDVINRGQLIDDSFHIAKAGYIDHLLHLKTMEYLKEETDYLPWFSAQVSIAHFTKMFSYHPYYIYFQDYIRSLLGTHQERLGWTEKGSDTHHDIYLRDLILTHSCAFGNADCIQTAKEYFAAWKRDPTNSSIIRPDIRDPVYCTAIRNGLSEDWDFLFEQYKNFEHFSFEKSRMRRALTCTDDIPTLTRLFKWAVEGNEVIHSHDPSGPAAIMRYISRTPIAQYSVWDYLDSHWDSIGMKYTLLATVTEGFSTDYDLEKFDKLVANHPPTFENEQFHFEDVRIVIEHNNRWRKTNEQEMFNWLRDVTT